MLRIQSFFCLLTAETHATHSPLLYWLKILRLFLLLAEIIEARISIGWTMNILRLFLLLAENIKARISIGLKNIEALPSIGWKYWGSSFYWLKILRLFFLLAECVETLHHTFGCILQTLLPFSMQSRWQRRDGVCVVTTKLLSCPRIVNAYRSYRLPSKLFYFWKEKYQLIKVTKKFNLVPTVRKLCVRVFVDNAENMSA